MFQVMEVPCSLYLSHSFLYNEADPIHWFQMDSEKPPGSLEGPKVTMSFHQVIGFNSFVANLLNQLQPVPPNLIPDTMILTPPPTPQINFSNLLHPTVHEPTTAALAPKHSKQVKLGKKPVKIRKTTVKNHKQAAKTNSENQPEAAPQDLIPNTMLHTTPPVNTQHPIVLDPTTAIIDPKTHTNQNTPRKVKMSKKAAKTTLENGPKVNKNRTLREEQAQNALKFKENIEIEEDISGVKTFKCRICQVFQNFCDL